MKIIIASPHCNKEFYIDYQYRSVKKYVQDNDYEFVIFNDSRNVSNNENFNDNKVHEKIKNKCQDLNIPCIDIPQELHAHRNYVFPSTFYNYEINHIAARQSVVLQYIYNLFCNQKDTILLIMEEDMFFTRPYHVEKSMNQFDMMCFLQLKHKTSDMNYFCTYCWPAFIGFNLETLPNKHQISFEFGGVINIPVDPGGHLIYHLLDNPQTKIKLMQNNFFINRESLNVYKEKMNYPELEGFLNDICHTKHTLQFGMDYNREIGIEYIDNCILHIRNGSNWQHFSKEIDDEINKSVDKFLNHILDDSFTPNQTTSLEFYKLYPLYIYNNRSIPVLQNFYVDSEYENSAWIVKNSDKHKRPYYECVETKDKSWVWPPVLQFWCNLDRPENIL